ncbi:MAG: four-helix bundle copper-binding protein [Bacteroidia bacterium]
MCNHCASMDLKETGQNMNRCAQLDMECAAVCYAAAQLMSLGSEHSKAICKICADLCNQCAEECEKYDDEHCKECAEACRKCAKECSKM